MNFESLARSCQQITGKFLSVELFYREDINLLTNADYNSAITTMLNLRVNQHASNNTNKLLSEYVIFNTHSNSAILK